MKLFFQIRLTELNLCLIRLKELNLFLIWFKELAPFYDSKNWIFFPVWLTDFFLNTTHKNEPLIFEYDQRIELFLFWYESNNWILFLFDSKNWTHYVGMTQRIELFFTDKLEDLNFLNTAQRIEHVFFIMNMTQRFFQKMWLKELKLFLKTLELNLFFADDSKKWTFFFLKMTPRIELFFDVTQRI